MPEEKPKAPQNRRGFLKLLSLKGLTGLARMLPLTGLGESTQRDPLTSELPGEGSIFQPRQDQRLEEWLKKHPKKG